MSTVPSLYPSNSVTVMDWGVTDAKQGRRRSQGRCDNKMGAIKKNAAASTCAVMAERLARGRNRDLEERINCVSTAQRSQHTPRVIHHPHARARLLRKR